MEHVIILDGDESEDAGISPEVFNRTASDRSASSTSANILTLNYKDTTSDEHNMSDAKFIRQNVVNQASEAESLLIPAISNSPYDRAYNKLKLFLKDQQIKVINEAVLLAYFKLLKRPNGVDPKLKVKPGLAPSSLWAIYSMLKKTLWAYDNVNIQGYLKLLSFLSSNARHSDHVPQKSHIFTQEQIAQFMKTAPDKDWLAIKVACIIGIHGCCKQTELHNLTHDHIEDHGTCLTFNMVKTKNLSDRPFPITGLHCKIVKKYMSLRPPGFKAKDNFFLRYQNGKCHRAVIGKNTLATYPKRIASFLGLPNPEKYTGHSFRLTGATIGVESGRDMRNLGEVEEESNACMEGYSHADAGPRMRNSSEISEAIIQENTSSFTIIKADTLLPSQPGDLVTSGVGGTSHPSKRIRLDSQAHSSPSTISHAVDNELLLDHKPNVDSSSTIYLHVDNCFSTHDEGNSH